MRKPRGQSKRTDGDQLLPSEEYLRNLTLSFSFQKISQSLSNPSNNRAERNIRKEDNTVMYAHM